MLLQTFYYVIENLLQLLTFICLFIILSYIILSTILHLWEDNRTKGEVKAENQDTLCKKSTVSEEAQQLALHSYN